VVPAVDSTGALRDVSLEVWAAHSELPYFEKVLTLLKASLLSRCFSMFLGGLITLPSFGSSLLMQWFREPPSPTGKENGQV